MMQDLLQGSRFGTFMFLLYMLVVFFILLTMFVTIVNEAFAAVCDDASKQSNDYEMVDFMIARFKRWTGLAGIMKKLGKGNPGDDELDSSKVPSVILYIVLYSVPAAAKFASRCTKRIITVTIKYVIYANKSLILTLTLNPI